MSITIDDMKMPKSCMACPFEHNGDCYGGKPKRIMDIEDFKDSRHPDCPLIEVEPIVHCEDCRHHEDEELGMVWCPYIVGSWVENDFYCANGEKGKEEKMTIEEKYNEKHNQYCKGEITLEEWYEFCSLVLEIIMDENKDILKNLKENW